MGHHLKKKRIKRQQNKAGRGTLIKIKAIIN